MSPIHADFLLRRRTNHFRRARLSFDEEGDDDVSTERGSPLPQPVPRRALPKRTAYVITIELNARWADDICTELQRSPSRLLS